MKKIKKIMKKQFHQPIDIPNNKETLKALLKIQPKKTHSWISTIKTYKLTFSMVSFALLMFMLLGGISIRTYINAPVYQGMTVEAYDDPNRLLSMRQPLHLQTPSTFQTTDAFDDVIEDTFEVITSPGISYYASPGETIMITVLLDNPNDYEILSFTLNGILYQSFEFLKGSNSNKLLILFDTTTQSGIQEVTIDAIKYVDGTIIRNARFAADKTIDIGITYTNLPEVTSLNETVSYTSFDLSIDILDTESLLDTTNLPLLYIFDGEVITQTQTLNIGLNQITVSNLLMGNSYEYAVVAVYNPLDGLGQRPFVLASNTFETLDGMALTIDEITTTAVTYSVKELTENVELISVSLYDGDTLIETNNTSVTFTFNTLLSNTDYVLEMTYAYTLNGTTFTKTVTGNFKTTALTPPSLTITSIVAFDTSLFATFRLSDPDAIARIIRFDLYKDGELIEFIDNNIDISLVSGETFIYEGNLTFTYTGPGDYLVVAIYAYNLNDGYEDMLINSIDIDADNTLRFISE